MQAATLRGVIMPIDFYPSFDCGKPDDHCRPGLGCLLSARAPQRLSYYQYRIELPLGSALVADSSAHATDTTASRLGRCGVRPGLRKRNVCHGLRDLVWGSSPHDGHQRRSRSAFSADPECCNGRLAPWRESLDAKWSLRPHHTGGRSLGNIFLETSSGQMKFEGPRLPSLGTRRI